MSSFFNCVFVCFGPFSFVRFDRDSRFQCDRLVICDLRGFTYVPYFALRGFGSLGVLGVWAFGIKKVTYRCCLLTCFVKETDVAVGECFFFLSFL